MSRKPVDSSRYDAANLEWAKGVLADPMAIHRLGIGLVKIARATVERIEGVQISLRPTPDKEVTDAQG